MAKCAYHPERDSVGACVNCGRLVCAECKTELRGRIHCNPCVDKMLAGKIEVPAVASKKQQVKQIIVPKRHGDEMQGQLKTGVEVKTGFFPLAWFLFFCTPTIVVNGKAYRKSWGTHFFELEPGRHTIRIFFGYLFMPECGANSIDVTVEEGKISRVKYFMPPWMLAKGSIKELQEYMKGRAPLAKVVAIDISPKSRRAVTLLACIIGVLGAHRFYLGKTRTAVGMLALSVLFCVFYVLGLAQHNFAGRVGDLLAVLSMLCMAAVGIWALIDFIFAVTGKMKDKGGKPIKNW